MKKPARFELRLEDPLRARLDAAVALSKTGETAADIVRAGIVRELAAREGGMPGMAAVIGALTAAMPLEPAQSRRRRRPKAAKTP